MVHTVEVDYNAGNNPVEEGINLPGLAAAAVWALAFVVGLVALAAGYFMPATIALGLSVVAPWLGLAWVTRGSDHGEAPK
jgi:hypothetical protein